MRRQMMQFQGIAFLLLVFRGLVFDVATRGFIQIYVMQIFRFLFRVYCF